MLPVAAVVIPFQLVSVVDYTQASRRTAAQSVPDISLFVVPENRVNGVNTLYLSNQPIIALIN